MPAKIECEQKLNVIILDSQIELNPNEISKSVGFSTRTLQRAKKRLITYGDIEGGKKKEVQRAN